MINREKWTEIIKDFHEKGVPDLIERGIDIPTETPLRRAISIIGPRRAGKTYVMFQLIKKLLRDKIDMNRILYVNLEKTDLEGADIRDLDGLIRTYYEIYPENKNRKIWLFLDEIQNIDKWEKFVRTIIDSEYIQVFISGSSSKLLSREIATSLRGRTITYTVLPFSFRDYLISEKIETSKHLSTTERSKIIRALSEYLNIGGYPEVVIYRKEMEKILLDIVETMIYRDIVERYKIRNTNLLKLLIKSLINSAEREFSVHKFYNFVKSKGIKASKATLYNYLDALSDVFFVFPVRKFSGSYKETEQSLPKIYLVDNGILTTNGITDNGRLMENLVFTELKRRGKYIHYYKSVDNKEVDFVVLEKKKVKELIQVAYSLDDMNTKEREIKPLLKASKELKCSKLLIVTWDKEGYEKISGRKIEYIPLWKWLLR